MNSVQHTEEENELRDQPRIRWSEAKPIRIRNVEPKEYAITYEKNQVLNKFVL